MRRFMIIAAMAGSVATSAAGQSIGDTFNQLRSTLRQLGGRKAPSAPSASPPSIASSESSAEDMSVVPARVLLDDRSDTSLVDAPVVARRIATFDVRGFRLGMSPREVGRIAQREQFRRRWNSIFQTTGSFEFEATTLANQRLNRPVERSSKPQLSKVQAFDPTGNEINLEFTLEPVGPRLSRLTYSAKLNGTTLQQARSALIARYGPPVGPQTGTDQLSWRNGSDPFDLASPYFGAVFGESTMSLNLNQSVNYGLEARRRMQARAAAIAASEGGGISF